MNQRRASLLLPKGSKLFFLICKIACIKTDGAGVRSLFKAGLAGSSLGNILSICSLNYCVNLKGISHMSEKNILPSCFVLMQPGLFPG